jgi:CheY-like chemotaxis protein
LPEHIAFLHVVKVHNVVCDLMMIHYRKRILIVEDNKADVRLLKDILEKRAYDTLQTGDGLEAISLALAHSLDLILMDAEGLRRWVMPHLDGYGSLRQAAAQQGFFSRPAEA